MRAPPRPLLPLLATLATLLLALAPAAPSPWTTTIIADSDGGGMAATGPLEEGASEWLSLSGGGGGGGGGGALRVERLPGKGRGMVAATPLSAGRLLFTERPLSTAPFLSSSAQGLTPQSVVDELALRLLQAADSSGYHQLCHHIDQGQGNNSTSPSISTAPLRPSPSPLYSDLQFSTAVSQVESNAFATELTQREAEEWWKQRRVQPQQQLQESREQADAIVEVKREEVERREEEAEQTAGAAAEKAKRRRRRKKKRSTTAAAVREGAVEAAAAVVRGASPSLASAPASSASSLRVLTLYLQVSMLNHCCNPNAAVYWDSPDESPSTSSSSSSPSLPRVYAIVDIAEGAEVCIAYRADLLHFPTHLRRSLIEQSWHFHCTCDRCSRPADFREEQRLLALTRALSDAEQQRMLADFAALVAYADDLQRSAGHSAAAAAAAFSPDSSPSLHPPMRRRLNAFFELPLSVTHWRLHRLRSLFLPLLLPQAAVPYAYKRRLLEAHITSNQVVLPALHPSKLTFLLTLRSLIQLEQGTQSDADAALRQLEPHTDRILQLFDSHSQHITATTTPATTKDSADALGDPLPPRST